MGKRAEKVPARAHESDVDSHLVGRCGALYLLVAKDGIRRRLLEVFVLPKGDHAVEVDFHYGADWLREEVEWRAAADDGRVAADGRVDGRLVDDGRLAAAVAVVVADDAAVDVGGVTAALGSLGARRNEESAGEYASVPT